MVYGSQPAMRREIALAIPCPAYEKATCSILRDIRMICQFLII